MKKILLGLNKGVERLAEEVEENIASRRKEKSGTSDGLVLKMGKLEEIDVTMTLGQGMTDKSNYKKLKILVFAGENQESWVY